MSIQVYRCPVHGEFERTVAIKDGVPPQVRCPRKLFKGDLAHTCNGWSEWVPSAPNFIGGPTTGAKKE